MPSSVSEGSLPAKIIYDIMTIRGVIISLGIIFKIYLDKLGYFKEREGKMTRPVTTLFMLMSVDGKISTGATDDFDVDADFPKLSGVKEGLDQYYRLEQSTDLWSLNSGRVQAKLGVNGKPLPHKTAVSFVLLDNSHLTAAGIRYFCALSQHFVLVTNNTNHPAFSLRENNMDIIYQQETDLKAMLEILYEKYSCQRLTIQTGGTLNGLFLRQKLLDYLNIVVAPVLIGGKDTSTLIDGESVTSIEDLDELGILKLEECYKLQNSYLQLIYKVVG